MANHFFNVCNTHNRQLLLTERLDVFHRMVAQLLFLSTRARRDIYTPVLFLCTRVKGTDKDDWHKVVCVLQYLRRNPSLGLTLLIYDNSLVH